MKAFNFIRGFAGSAVTVSLLALAGMHAVAQENRNVKIINHSSSSIRYLYASNVDSGVWSKDLIGPMSVILTDYYMIFNFDDGTGHCLFDIKAVLYDERVAITHNLNVCTNGSWTVTEN